MSSNYKCMFIPTRTITYTHTYTDAWLFLIHKIVNYNFEMKRSGFDLILAYETRRERLRMCNVRQRLILYETYGSL